MATIISIYNRIKKLDTDTICIESVRETKESIEDLNAEQMFSGLRSDGTEILPNYSPLTIFLKQQKGQPTDRVTLRDTGDFYAGITTNITNDSVITTSTDEKTEKLKKKYSTSKGSIFGLGGEFKLRYIDETLRPAFVVKMTKATGLKFKK